MLRPQYKNTEQLLIIAHTVCNPMHKVLHEQKLVTKLFLILSHPCVSVIKCNASATCRLFEPPFNSSTISKIRAKNFHSLQSYVRAI